MTGREDQIWQIIAVAVVAAGLMLAAGAPPAPLRTATATACMQAIRFIFFAPDPIPLLMQRWPEPYGRDAKPTSNVDATM
jgi:hypothetical protein